MYPSQFTKPAFCVHSYHMYSYRITRIVGMIQKSLTGWNADQVYSDSYNDRLTGNLLTSCPCGADLREDSYLPMASA